VTARRARIAGWTALLVVSVGVRLWNALAGPRMWGYDAWGHVAYVFFLDLYRAVPWADQGWSYFHPPGHYLIGWALAQAGSGELLMRGLALWGSFASLATAALAARLAHLGFPARPGLALLAFGAVAFLPVHFYMSPMPGNEMTATLLGAAALASFVRNEFAARPSLRADAVTSLWLGLGLLTKFSGLLPLLALLGALVLRAALEPAPARALRRAAARGAGIAALALLIAAPYYARNLAAFGNPFELSRGYPLVAQVESGQPPGARGWRDFATLSPRVFRDPNPLAPHMYRSVWGSVYVNVWADLYRESDVARALEAEREERLSTRALALLGLLPSALALAGAGLALRDFARGRRRALWAAPLLLSAATLASFGLFAWRVPIWSALKASYLLGLSLPFALFLCRAFEALLARGRRGLGAALAAGLAAVALAASAVAVDGLVLPKRADAPATGAVRFYFGEYEAARRVYDRLIAGAVYPVPWLDNLAAVELADGAPERARLLYARAVMLERERGRLDPYRQGQLAAATALAGDAEGALSLLDQALERASLPELLANRGALRAAQGDEVRARVDLLDAIAQAPELVAARVNLARVLEREGRGTEAEAAWAAAAQAACQGPRGFPYGVGTGEVLEWGVGRRWLLLLEEGGLAPALPEFLRKACARLSRSSPVSATGGAG
jgi:tetratricopeptide (TPR) repeat protein